MPGSTQRRSTAAGARRLQSVDVVDGLLAPGYLRALLSRPSGVEQRDPERSVENLVILAGHRGAQP